MRFEADPHWKRVAYSRAGAGLRPYVRVVTLAGALAAALPAAAIETAVVVSPTPIAGAEMAYAVGLDGTQIVVGAPGEDSTTGALYTMDCATSPCTVPARIAPDDLLVVHSEFGFAVAISGDTLVATAPGKEPGAAYVYTRAADHWTYQTQLTATGGSSGERFGFSVALSGDRLAVGADRANNGAGAIYVFARSGATWVQEARLVASDGIARDALGTSVALDGETLVAGAPIKRTNGSSSYANGVAYVFARDGSGWSQQAELSSASVGNGALFGFAVDVAGDRVVVGAPYAASLQGNAYVFDRSGSNWTQTAQLASSTAAPGDEFGWSVALGDTNILVGAPFAGQSVDAACGGTYLFDGAALAPQPSATIQQPQLNELAGWSTAASGARWVTSAPGHLVGTADHAGAAYWFDPTMTLFHSGFDVSGACVGGEEPG